MENGFSCGSSRRRHCDDVFHVVWSISIMLDYCRKPTLTALEQKSHDINGFHTTMLTSQAHLWIHNKTERLTEAEETPQPSSL